MYLGRGYGKKVRVPDIHDLFSHKVITAPRQENFFFQLP